MLFIGKFRLPEDHPQKTRAQDQPELDRTKGSEQKSKRAAYMFGMSTTAWRRINLAVVAVGTVLFGYEAYYQYSAHQSHHAEIALTAMIWVWSYGTVQSGYLHNIDRAEK